MTILPIATVLAVALCAAVPAGAADKADLVRVDKSDRRLELLRKGTVLRSYRVALGNAPEQVASMFLVPRVVDA